MVLGYKLVPHSTYASPPGYAGLLKVQTHCPRPERLAARSVYSVNNPGQLSSRRLKNNTEVANGKRTGGRLDAYREAQNESQRLKTRDLCPLPGYPRQRTPWYAKAFVACVVAYALSPIDLIPDPIPILGYLDDLLLLPIGIYLALKMIPEPVLAECRQKAAASSTKLPCNRIAAAIMIALWF